MENASQRGNLDITIGPEQTQYDKFEEALSHVSTLYGEIVDRVDAINSAKTDHSRPEFIRYNSLESERDISIVRSGEGRLNAITILEYGVDGRPELKPSFYSLSKYDIGDGNLAVILSKGEIGALALSKGVRQHSFESQAAHIHNKMDHLFREHTEGMEGVDEMNIEEVLHYKLITSPEELQKIIETFNARLIEYDAVLQSQEIGKVQDAEKKQQDVDNLALNSMEDELIEIS